MTDEQLSLDIIERRRAWAQPVLDAHKARTAYMEKAAIECGNLALKALLLVNGGACIALLGFLSSTFNAATSQSEAPRSIFALLTGIVLDNGVAAERARLILDVTAALSWFGWGTAAAVFGTAIAYLTNSFYARALTFADTKYDWPYVTDGQKSKREWFKAGVLNWIAVVAGVAAIVCFAGGILTVQHIY